MKKRLIALVLAMVLALSLFVPAAAAYTQNVAINYRAIKLVLNGERIVPCDGAGTTVEPFIMSSTGTTYLPLRAVAQALGLNVKWDGAANTVTLSSGGNVKTGAGPEGASFGQQYVGITYRNIKIFLNGEELSLVNANGDKVEPFILNSNSSVYLPLRVIGEALGLKVGWDGATSTVSLEGGDESGVKGVELDQYILFKEKGDGAQLIATVTPADAKDPSITWESSDESVAAVDQNGYVTTLGKGEAIITAKAVNGKKAECTVHVAEGGFTIYYKDNTVAKAPAEEVMWYMDMHSSFEPVSMIPSDGGTYTNYDGSYNWTYGEGYLYYDGYDETPYVKNAPWYKYNDEVHTAYVKRGFSTIGSFAFDEWDSLNYVEVPDTVTYIDSYAFSDCSLVRLGIPASVSKIDSHMLDTYARPSESSNKNVNIYCEPGSAAESFAIKYGLDYIHASVVYYPDGRTRMVSADERQVHLDNGWYSYPVTIVYGDDGSEKVIEGSEYEYYISLGWHGDRSEVYTTMYALDGRSKEVLNIKIAAEQSVGWYLYPDYICALADQKVNTEGWEAGVSYIEDIIWDTDENDANYQKFVNKKSQLCSSWCASLGDPIAITGYNITWNSIGVPEVNITFRNISGKTVSSLEAFWTCVDPYGRPTSDYYWYNGNYNGWMNGISLEPGEAASYYWTLYSNEQTTDVKNLRMEKCAFSDGSSWYYTAWYYG